MHKLFFLIAIIFFLLGCGGGSSSSNESNSVDSNTYPTPNVPIETTMVIDEQYIVFPGDRVIKTSLESLIKIYRNDDINQTTVTLIDGNATLIQTP